MHHKSSLLFTAAVGVAVFTSFLTARAVSPTYGMSAAIYNAPDGGSPTSGWTVLVDGSYDQTVGSFQTLVAPNVAANTPIAVVFWQWAGSPGIDNVTVVPEPSTYALLVLAAGGLAAHVVRRGRLR
jgi:hypothetical protein